MRVRGLVLSAGLLGPFVAACSGAGGAEEMGDSKPEGDDSCLTEDCASDHEGSNDESSDSGDDSELPSDSTDPTDDVCALVPSEASLELSLDSARQLPGAGERAFVVGDKLVACGPGFLSVFDASGAALTGLEWTSDDSTCVGLLVDEHEAVWVADATQGLRRIELDASGAKLTQSLAWPMELRAESMAIRGSQRFVAVGKDGIVAVERDDDGEASLEEARPIGDALDLRDIQATASGWLVSTGPKGVALLDEAAETVLDTYRGYGFAQRSVVRDDEAIIVRAGWGIELVQLDADRIEAKASAIGRGVAVDARFVGDDILVANAGGILHWGRSGAYSFEELGGRLRPDLGTFAGRWFVGFDAGQGGDGFALWGDQLVPLHVREGLSSASLAPDATSYSAWSDAAGDAAYLTRFVNRGRERVAIGDVEASKPFVSELLADDLEPRAGCPGQYWVAPDQSFDIWVETAQSDGSPDRGELRFAASDPYISDWTIELDLNRPTLEVGTSMPELTLPDNRGRSVAIHKLHGEVVFLKLFDLT